MLVRQPHKNTGGIQMDVNSLSHTKWNCKYHIVFAVRGSLTASLGYKDPDSMSLTFATVMGM